MSRFDEKMHLDLMQQFERLATFRDVASWDERADARRKEIEDALREEEANILDTTERLRIAKQQRTLTPFWKRLFQSKAPQDALSMEIRLANARRLRFEAAGEELEAKVIFSPNNAAEQKSLIKELKIRLKELRLEKKALAAEAKMIRRNARQESVDAGRQLFGLLYDRTLAADQRRSINYRKEALLMPHESAMDALDRQIHRVQERMLWVEKFRD